MSGIRPFQDILRSYLHSFIQSAYPIIVEWNFPDDKCLSIVDPIVFRTNFAWFAFRDEWTHYASLFFL